MWNPSSSLADDTPSAHSLSPSPTNESSYQDIYDDPRPTVPRQPTMLSHRPRLRSRPSPTCLPALTSARVSPTAITFSNQRVQLPRHNPRPPFLVKPTMLSHRPRLRSRPSPTCLPALTSARDTLRILRIEDPEPPQPTNYVNYSGDGTNSPTVRTSRTYASAAASTDANEAGLTTSRFSQKSRRSAKVCPRFFGPNESSAIVDVEWSHQSMFSPSSNIIITAFGAGELVSWDLNRLQEPNSVGPSVPMYRMTLMEADRTAPGAHIRSINCIRISPSIGLAVVSHFAQDLRSFKPVVQIAHHGMAVRALAFSPGTESAQALVGLETGQLLRYDFRSPKTALDRLPVAHSSAILSIDWQSIGSGGTAGWAATGGWTRLSR
ncbi:WD40 domain-containing protein [Rhizoctonia solani]|uniref:WD40 domain-containing protein n=1 Tax=Rhizoctonia solani TaxID=456999 RepID=A0A8H8T1I3_9AGAM|nr:WD40 domain-containing protein [Rhizoctonia solani]QRW24508.1 WD40 domain-containing protein [Rhizoctonia solani]